MSLDFSARWGQLPSPARFRTQHIALKAETGCSSDAKLAGAQFWDLQALPPKYHLSELFNSSNTNRLQHLTSLQIALRNGNWYRYYYRALGGGQGDSCCNTQLISGDSDSRDPPLAKFNSFWFYLISTRPLPHHFVAIKEQRAQNYFVTEWYFSKQTNSGCPVQSSDYLEDI